MKKTIVVYGTSMGISEGIANDIAIKLGCKALNVQELSKEVVNEFDNLILGTSTWGHGEAQDDWFNGLKILKSSDLSNKTIAIFGSGDSVVYADRFCSGMSDLYNVVKAGGANIIGSVSTDDYHFEDSKAVIDGKFVGLALDNENEESKTPSRIASWLESISSSL